jgi:NADH:ubiquinone oxidoreductase subunit E
MSTDEMVALKNKADQRRRPHRICVCTAASCQSIGADRVLKALEATVASGQRESEVEVRAVGCIS